MCYFPVVLSIITAGFDLCQKSTKPVDFSSYDASFLELLSYTTVERGFPASFHRPAVWEGNIFMTLSV